MKFLKNNISLSFFTNINIQIKSRLLYIYFYSLIKLICYFYLNINYI